MRLVVKAVLVVAACAMLSAAGAKDGPRRLFAGDDVINITLSGPLKSLSRDKHAKSVPGTLKLEGAAPETLPVQLSTRGVTRRRRDVCDFPPIRVEFAQKPEDNSLFKGQKSLKLVTHCQSGDKYKQDVLLEYAAYRLYQVLTPESFRVRLANVSYQDESGNAIDQRPGFFIEEVSDVAKRNGQKRLHVAGQIQVSQLDAEKAARFAIFEDLIGNLDWAMNASEPGADCCHNARLLTAAGATTNLTPVPYDFDMSGLVDAPYAGAPKAFHLTSVRERHYHGFCAHNALMQPAAAEFVAHKAAFLAVIDQIPDLSTTARAKATSYLNDFFDDMAAPQKITQMQMYCVHGGTP